MLYNLPETVPYNWSATWDELADVELKIRWLQAGTGLIDAPEFRPRWATRTRASRLTSTC